MAGDAVGGQDGCRETGAGIDAGRSSHQWIILRGFVLKPRGIAGNERAVVIHRPCESAERGHPAGLDPVMREIDHARRVHHRQRAARSGDVEDIVTCVTILLVRRKAEERRAIRASGDDRIVIAVECSLAVVRRRAAVAAVVNDLPVPSAIGLDEHIAVNHRGAIPRIVADKSGVFRIHQVELPVAGLYPVIAHHQAGGAVLEVITQASRPQRAEAIVLESDADRRGIVIVFQDAARVTVVVNRVALD